MKLKFSDFVEVKDMSHHEMRDLPATVYISGHQLEPNDVAKLAILNAFVGVLNKKGLLKELVSFEIGRNPTHYSGDDNG